MELSQRLKSRKEAEEEDIREAKEQRQYLKQYQKVQEQKPIDDTMGGDDDPMGEHSFDDAMSVNEVNGRRPTDTESKMVKCPDRNIKQTKRK